MKNRKKEVVVYNSLMEFEKKYFPNSFKEVQEEEKYSDSCTLQNMLNRKFVRELQEELKK